VEMLMGHGIPVEVVGAGNSKGSVCTSFGGKAGQWTELGSIANREKNVVCVFGEEGKEVAVWFEGVECILMRQLVAGVCVLALAARHRPLQIGGRGGSERMACGCGSLLRRGELGAHARWEAVR
jgi:hypothetical protein